MIPIYAELVYPTRRRANKVIARAIIVDFVFYFTIAMAGFWSMYDKTAVIILERVTDGGSADVPGIIGIIAVIGSIVVAFPCAYFPTR